MACPRWAHWWVFAAARRRAVCHVGVSRALCRGMVFIPDLGTGARGFLTAQADAAGGARTLTGVSPPCLRRCSKAVQAERGQNWGWGLPAAPRGSPWTRKAGAWSGAQRCEAWGGLPGPLGPVGRGWGLGPAQLSLTSH